MTNWLDIFAAICEIPHTSGQEAALRDWLTARAAAAGLRTRTDRKGNLAIERDAAPGCEATPVTILQAHLDMVPQVRPGYAFDFQRDAVPWQIDGDWLHTAGKTTLGADNGIAVALILELLLNPELRSGALRALFTVEEEIGLNGAAEVDPAFLDARWLINLDAEDDRSFFIGCAGGMRLGGLLPIPWRVADRRLPGYAIEVSGLPGGHSGVDIAKNRGNANLVLLDVLAANPAFQLATLDGGTVDNAIPRECRATGCAPAAPEVAAVQEAWRAALGANGEALCITVQPIPAPTQVWEKTRQTAFLAAMRQIPNGVLKVSKFYAPVVETSSNLAAFHTLPEALVIHTSQRSLLDSERQKATAAIRAALEGIGAECSEDNFYGAWTPRPDSELVRHADACYEALFGRRPGHEIMHAGLEPAAFTAVNATLQMIAAGPEMHDPHSPAERVSVSSIERIRLWLYRVLADRG